MLITVVEDSINYGWYDVMRARSSDIPSIRDIDALSLVSSVSENWFHERREHYKDRFLIARKHSNGEIIGYLSAAHHLYYPEHLPGYVYLSRFAVKNQFRRCGVGTALLVTLYEHLHEAKEYRGVVADVRKSNIPSLRFFTGKHLFFKNNELSRSKWYERGETEDDRYKIVVYKPFGLEDL
jgi:ribosomal protein S18 acetylase RimI-like enzyme